MTNDAQERRLTSDLEVQLWGEGVDAVLVHGSISTGTECWEGQRPLADHGFRLLVPDRRGYGDAAEGLGEDFLTDAEDVAELLGDGAHLVGHSYGALAALLAAAARPDAVRQRFQSSSSPARIIGRSTRSATSSREDLGPSVP